MVDSILTDTKKYLNIVEDYEVFDPDIVMAINSSFSVVGQVGIGPNGFAIEDASSTWSELTVPTDQLGLLKSYIFLSSKMLFDPPNTSFQIDAIEKRLQEYLVRMSYIREGLTSGDDEEVAAESASGTQDTPASVWIMDHNLGFNPAGFRFTTLDESDELEPEAITYVTVNRTLALWPSPITGKWIVS